MFDETLTLASTASLATSGALCPAARSLRQKGNRIESAKPPPAIAGELVLVSGRAGAIEAITYGHAQLTQDLVMRQARYYYRGPFPHMNFRKKNTPLVAKYESVPWALHDGSGALLQVYEPEKADLVAPPHAGVSLKSTEGLPQEQLVKRSQKPATTCLALALVLGLAGMGILVFKRWRMRRNRSVPPAEEDLQAQIAAAEAAEMRQQMFNQSSTGKAARKAINDVQKAREADYAERNDRVRAVLARDWDD
ncbi:hypothetical protein WJX84_010862 [Apatococcus fuscideae]|uniref:Uncharacterized protein n=1 Tax=Apatococcus fuscideae TaxID=2026836 RepID=A0AAW1SBQ5_9CHLO